MNFDSDFSEYFISIYFISLVYIRSQPESLIFAVIRFDYFLALDLVSGGTFL